MAANQISKDPILLCGKDVLFELNAIIQPYKNERIVIVCDTNTKIACLPVLLNNVPELKDASVFVLPLGEVAKSFQELERLCLFLLNEGLGRKGLMINLGGGIVGDMGGFAASIFVRGVDFIQIPTTVLAMVDASVGGKTGVNFGGFKNMLGTFTQPSAVLIYPDFIETLPVRERISGFAEMIKHALLSGTDAWKEMQQFNPEQTNRWEEMIAQSVAFKHRITQADFLENGLREQLNLGHTMAHAFETLALKRGEELLHGCAVASGILAELILADELHILTDKSLIADYAHVFFKHFKPVVFQEDELDLLIDFMRLDKKNKEGQVTFSLISAPGQIAPNNQVNEQSIRKALLSFMRPDYVIKLTSNNGSISGEIELPASKSISNRILILEAVSNGKVCGIGHSNASDTQILQKLIRTKPAIANAGAGGTTFRFLLAFFAATENYQGVLYGTTRLMERPVAPLVEALRKLGADIQYQQKEGFAPLVIRGKKLKGGTVSIDASISSQFLSALMLVAPLMENALVLKPQGSVVSPPYLLMTSTLMKNCGFVIEQSDTSIRIEPTIPENFIDVVIEKDWSSASYWYSMVALAQSAQIALKGLQQSSIQGDANCMEVFKMFGVESVENEDGIRLKKIDVTQKDLRIDCYATPDLFQTYAVTATALKLNAHFSGLQSLRFKETDRIYAVSEELTQLGARFSEPASHEVNINAENCTFHHSISFKTHDDHRMAMALTPLVLKLPSIQIHNSRVVEKSYPDFWGDVLKSGVGIQENTSY